MKITLGGGAGSVKADISFIRSTTAIKSSNFFYEMFQDPVVERPVAMTRK